MKNSTKRKLKKWGGIVGIILAAVALCALVGNLSDGFKNVNPKDWDISLRNDANIIPVDDMEKEYATDVGISIEQKNGVLTLSGKNKDTSNVTVDIATFTLPAGQYMFGTGADGRNKSASPMSYYMKLVNGSGALVSASDATTPFQVSEDMEVTLQLIVAAGEDVDDVKLYPAVVEGDEYLEYYDMFGNK